MKDFRKALLKIEPEFSEVKLDLILDERRYSGFRHNHMYVRGWWLCDILEHDPKIKFMFDVIVRGKPSTKYPSLDVKSLPMFEKFVFSLQKYYESMDELDNVITKRRISKYISKYYPSDEQIEVLFNKMKNKPKLYLQTVLNKDLSGKLHQKLNAYRDGRTIRKVASINDKKFMKYIRLTFGTGKHVMEIATLISRICEELLGDDKLCKFIYRGLEAASRLDKNKII